jgi:hypothetical protein
MSISRLDSPEQYTSSEVSAPWALGSIHVGHAPAGKSVLPTATPSADGAQPTVLIFGHDPILLKTRQWILARHGYRCGTVMHIDDVRRGFAESPIRLLILCYTLPECDCDQAIEIAHSRTATQSLVLIYGHTHCEMAESSAVLNVLDGPAALISLVDKLLQSPTPAHDS